MSVAQPGLTCACIGYVESKASGLCFFKQSLWSLAYSTENYTNGTMSSRWTNMQSSFEGAEGDEFNILQVQDASEGTVACNKEEICAEQMIWGEPGTYWEAGTAGPVYVSHVACPRIDAHR